ncbi:hypothetical protein ACHAWF_007731 [Thalassiosira exigua]
MSLEVMGATRTTRTTRQQDAYADTTIPYVDAEVAAALCKVGLVVYVVKEESGINNTWVLDYVMPAMKEHVSRQVAIVLDRPPLWKVFHDKSREHVPSQFKERTLPAYRDLGDRNSLEADTNPVAKVPLGIAGIDTEVIIEEIMVSDPGNDGNPQVRDFCVHRGMTRQDIRLLLSQMMYLWRGLADTRAKSERWDVQLKHKLTRLIRNVARLAAIPDRRFISADSEEVTRRANWFNLANPQEA